MLIRTVRELGHLVRDQRARRSLTQAQLAHTVGVSRKWIIDLEAGKPAADLSRVLRTLRALGIELDASEQVKTTRNAKSSSIDLDAIVHDAIVHRARGPKR